MKILHFDCSLGVSGDMLLAAMIDALNEPSVLDEFLSCLGLKDVHVRLEEKMVSSMRTRHLEVEWEKKQPLRHLDQLLELGRQGKFSRFVRARAEIVLRDLARVEAEVHGISPDEVHFHEIGAVDTIVDVYGFFWLLEQIDPDRITSTPLALGSGFMDMAHGRMPVPAPAVAELAKGLPVLSGPWPMELATPTGVALIKNAAPQFSAMPSGILQATGYGSGTRADDQCPSLVRAFVLSDDVKQQDDDGMIRQEQVAVLQTTVDDATGEDLGEVIDQALTAGALDAYLFAGTGKKSRPVFELTVLSPVGLMRELAQLMLRGTGSLGVRMQIQDRLAVHREIQTRSVRVQGRQFTVRMKASWVGEGFPRHIKPEFEDLKEIARTTGLSVQEVRNILADMHFSHKNH